MGGGGVAGEVGWRQRGNATGWEMAWREGAMEREGERAGETAKGTLLMVSLGSLGNVK